MENYNQMVQENHQHTSSSNNKNSRSNFSPYHDAGTPLGMTTPSHHHHHHMNMNDSGGGGSTGGGGGDYFQSALVAAAAAAAAAEDNSSNTVLKNESSQQQQPTRFYNYPLLTSAPDQHEQHLQFHQQVGGGRDHHVPSRGRDCEMLGVAGSNNNGNRRSGNDDNNAGDQRVVEVMKAKIIAHPQYPNLLQAYADCQKVGAPPDVAARLTVIRQDFEPRQKVPSSSSSSSPACSSKDPELDQFMEAYYDMLMKYREELTRPVQEAIEFMSRVEAQLHLLTDGRSRVFNSDEKSGAIAGSSEEEPENSGGETELPEIDPRAEDRELKNHLLRKYSGYLSSLKQELSKKKKKGKLPKEARQKLLSWWELHYKWPYPSESEKVALAEATGLDQKQINNWFINQRKRHWKPSEDMQFMVMDGIHPQNAALYMEGHYLGDGPYRFGT